MQEWVRFDEQKKALEDVIESGGGRWKLFILLYEFLVARAGRAGSSPTLLVNAAVVGGLRLRRGAPLS